MRTPCPYEAYAADFAAAQDLAEPIPGPTTELGLVTVFNMYETAGERCFDSSPVFDADGTLCGITRIVHVTD